MRGQDDAPSVASPVHHVERAIILRKIWIAAVAEDAFDKIKIADETGRRKETGLHRFRGIGPGCRAHQGTQQQADEESYLFLLVCREWQRLDILGGSQRRA